MLSTSLNKTFPSLPFHDVFQFAATVELSAGNGTSQKTTTSVNALTPTFCTALTGGASVDSLPTVSNSIPDIDK